MTRSPAARGLDALRVRTLLVGVLMLACGIGGVGLLLEPVGRLVALAMAASSPADLPPVHLPLPPEPGSWGGTLVHGSWLLLAALALAGHSVGALSRLSARWTLGALLGGGLMMVALVPPTGWSSTTLWPHPLARDITAGRVEVAERRISELKLPVPLEVYVRAQLALRSKDQAVLRRTGQLVVGQAELVVFGVEQAAGRNPLALLYEPEVVYRIDLALHGAPFTEVGMRWAQSAPAAGQRRWRAGELLRPALGGLLLAAAGTGLLMWNSMRRRVLLIQQVLATEQVPATEAAPQTFVATRPGPPGTAADSPSAAHGGTTRQPAGGSAKRAQRRWPVLPVLALSSALALAAAIGWRWQQGSAVEPPLAGRHPCALLGAWTGPWGDEGMMILQLDDDGRFSRRLVGTDPASPQMHGRWELLSGQRLALWPSDRPGREPGITLTLKDVRRDQFSFVNLGGLYIPFQRSAKPFSARCLVR